MRSRYGLTPSMIADLGPPDFRDENLHNSFGPLANLYSVERVERWVGENTERVEEAKSKRPARSAAGKLAHQRRLKNEELRKQEKLAPAIEWIDTANVVIEPLPDDLIEQVKREYKFKKNWPTLEQRGLLRWIRMKRTNFLSLLKELRRSPLCEGWMQRPLEEHLQARIDQLVGDALSEWAEGRDLN